MSRRDITVILERLTLDHRTSLAEKACAYLHAVESNGTIKNSPSHAAICVDIAADQLSIDVSRQALILLSGAPSHVTYANVLQTLTEFLIGSGNKGVGTEGVTGGNSSKKFTIRGINDNSRYAHMRRLLSSSTSSILRQLAVQYGSMEMDDLVLECLEKFFDVWVRSLVPAQRVHVHYSHEKWMGAAFWLCAMARSMIAPKETKDKDDKDKDKETTPAAKPKRIGGRQGKELKDMIMAAIGHKVQKKELETTIKLVEDKIPEYFISLMKSSSGNGSGKISKASSTTRKRKVSSTSDNITPDQSDRSRENSNALEDDSNNEDTSRTSSSRLSKQQAADPYKRLGTKRTISNVSQVSRSSDIEDGEDSEASRIGSRSKKPTIAQPLAKRTKMDSQNGSELSSAEIMGSKKNNSRKSLKEVAAAVSQADSPLLKQRRKTGGIYSMIPRVKYENTKAYAQYQEWRSRTLKAIELVS
ncbi:hypothetical protein FBU30_005777 [Linnemannia zychae]|nr:hypothetical protein FBU30_005777 [Linnemannia zychae]